MKKIICLIISFLGLSYPFWSQTVQKNISLSGLRYDGIYSTYDVSRMNCGESLNNHYKTYSHLNIINAESIIFHNGIGSRDYHFLKITSYNKMTGVSGKYVVIGNTLFATNVPIGLLAWGGENENVLCKF